jgi:hypothetical protein
MDLVTNFGLFVMCLLIGSGVVFIAVLVIAQFTKIQPQSERWWEKPDV